MAPVAVRCSRGKFHFVPAQGAGETSGRSPPASRRVRLKLAPAQGPGLAPALLLKAPLAVASTLHPKAPAAGFHSLRLTRSTAICELEEDEAKAGQRLCSLQ